CSSASSGRSSPSRAAATIISRRSGAAAMCCANPKRPRRPPSPEPDKAQALGKAGVRGDTGAGFLLGGGAPHPTLIPFGLSLSKPSPSLPAMEKKGRPFDRLRANGLVEV